LVLVNPFPITPTFRYRPTPLMWIDNYALLTDPVYTYTVSQKNFPPLNSL